MVGTDEDQVMCCFSGVWIARNEAVTVTIGLPNSDESQSLFSSKSELLRHLDKKIPVLPSLLD